jgi:DNA-binding CsgD family transcriptional regulator
LQGHSAKEVPTILQIGTRTVLIHEYAIMDTLGLKSTEELVRYAIEHGIKKN